MSKTRMAGSREFRDKIEERKGTEWYDKALKVGDLHDPHMSKENPGVARYTGAEIRAEMRHGRGDMTTEELTKKYEDLYAAGKINLNGNAKEFLRDHHGANLVRNSKRDDDKANAPTSPPSGNEDKPPSVVIPEKPDPIIPIPIPGPDRPSLGGNSQNLNINQDNDIISTINGDNNTITNTQDYSIDNSMGSSDYATRYARGLKDQYVLNLLNR